MSQFNISQNCKVYLKGKLEDCNKKIKKLKKKRKIIKSLYISSILASVTLSVVIVSLTGIATVPIYVITSLSAASGILTGVSAKFNLLGKKNEITILINKLNKIQNKLNYVISLNGDLTKAEFDSIVNDF